jgi:hypothetical protein
MAASAGVALSTITERGVVSMLIACPIKRIES